MTIEIALTAGDPDDKDSKKSHNFVDYRKR